MIIQLNIQGKLVIIVGGGNEALKRIRVLLKENCKILVISNMINSQIKTLVKNKKIQFKKQKIHDVSFISTYKPHIIITTIDNKKLNEEIIKTAKKNKIIAYSSDNPESSDFANPSIIDFENTVQIAIFTGGKSPAMSKKIRIKSEKFFKKLVTKEDIGQIKIQKVIRELAKKMISTQNERQMLLSNIMNDKEIKQLIRDGKLKRAEKQAMEILRNWK
jgi:precorrin-2 dehydrogenase/sirohydrochlorin ferrochelatase